jgi:AcrR family transcriptional regulator
MTEEEANRRDEILQAALEVFAEVGYEKASIKQIAKRANLKSPALIYWYFENKEELLKEVIGIVSPVIRMATDPELVLDQPPEELLTNIGMMMLSALQGAQAGRLFKLFMAEAIRDPSSVDHIVNSGPLMMLNMLRTYLRHQIDIGHLRDHNPETVARAFVSTLVIYIMAREILTPLGHGLPPIEEYVTEVVQVFLKGLNL